MIGVATATAKVFRTIQPNPRFIEMILNLLEFSFQLLEIGYCCQMTLREGASTIHLLGLAVSLIKQLRLMVTISHKSGGAPLDSQRTKKALSCSTIRSFTTETNLWQEGQVVEE